AVGSILGQEPILDGSLIGLCETNDELDRCMGPTEFAPQRRRDDLGEPAATQSISVGALRKTSSGMGLNLSLFIRMRHPTAPLVTLTSRRIYSICVREGDIQRPSKIPMQCGSASSESTGNSDAKSKAAQYVRMSTDYQKYSTENQADAIAKYA